MKYEDSIEQSAELLRKALPLMSRQTAGLHPVSYAIWYDYVSNRNPDLRQAIDEVMARSGTLDETATRHLFDRHVADFDADTAARVTEGFQRVLGHMATSAAQAGTDTARFGETLGRLSTALDQGDGHADAVAEALAETRTMQGNMKALQDRFDDSQKQIMALREEVRKAREESLLDALTGLANRRAFDQRLAACLASAVAGGESAPCLLVGDIDHFKKINDTWGHPFGDQVIKAVAAVLKALAPQGAMPARVGGEEFAVLLPESALPDAQTLAELVRQRISAARIRRHGADETLARVTLSLGVTRHKAGESPTDFFQRADQALYTSKSGGRDRVTVLPG